MGRIIRNSVLMLGSLVLLVPALSVAQSTATPSPCSACKAVPEGGSTAEYLAAAGIICAAGLLLRRGLRKAS
jgi:hypothetical protein